MSNLKVQRDTPPMEYGDKMDLDRLVLATSTRTDTYRRPISEANAELNGVNLKLVNYRLDGTVQKAREAALHLSLAEVREVLGEHTIPVIAMN